MLDEILETVVEDFPKDAEELQGKLTELFFAVDKVKESIKQQIVDLYSQSNYDKIQSYLEFSKKIDAVLGDMQRSIDSIQEKTKKTDSVREKQQHTPEVVAMGGRKK